MGFKTITQSAAIATALLSLAACGGSSSSSSTTGQLTLGLTDGPVEKAENVYVAFTGIEVKPADGPPMDPIVFDEGSCDDFDPMTGTCTIDLLQLTGDTRAVILSEELEAGDYQWIRLLVNAERNVIDSYIILKENGPMCSLYIPSGGNNGLKLVSGITVTANGVSDYTLDFDVRKSITQPPGLAGAAMDEAEMCAENYLMKPTIRIVDTTEVGTIQGTVSATLLEDSGCTRDETTMEYENVAVYVFEDFDADVPAVADDLDDDDTYPDPVTSANVVFDSDPNVDGYVYEAGFLASPADYLLALTCTAGDEDQPNEDDFDPDLLEAQDFGFIAEQTVTTVVGEAVDGSF